MRVLPVISIYIFLALAMACNTTKKVPASLPVVSIIKPPTMIAPDGTKTDTYLDTILKQNPLFDSVLHHKKDWNVQVIYTQIDRGANNLPKLTNYYFNVNPDRYYYPASTVKLPTALMALEKLNQLKNTGLTKGSTMITETAFSGQTPVFNDPLSRDGRPTIESYIKKIFLVSDNDAFNRLYEFLGQEYLNASLHKKGYENIQILRRLQLPLSEEENRHTNPIKFLGPNNNLLYEQPGAYNQTKYSPRKDSLGLSHYREGQFYPIPMNFSKKNRVNLEDLHNILRSVIFPNTVPAKQRFNISSDDYRFVLQYMSQFPPETLFPSYDSSQYQDAYGKFLLYGSRKGALPKNLRIFNKIGDAYGHMIDVAYMVDFDKQIEFFLSAEIYCNTDGIMNDDKYDYETIGFPFMKNLGTAIYDLESKRKRVHVPDLSAFKMTYDK